MMLCLYLDTFISVHRLCSMLGILNEISVQKELQNLMTNNGVWTKNIKPQQTQIYKRKSP